MNPDIKAFFDETTNTVSYVVSETKTYGCAIIDSVLDYDYKSGRSATESADRIVAYVRQKGLSTEWILETHAHADHLSAAPYLQEQLGGRIGIGEHIRDVQRIFKKVFHAEESFCTDGSQFDHLFQDGEDFHIGGLHAKAIHTPGHTPACLTYLVGNTAFVGDTLFMPDYGTARADFPGGDARILYRSIRKLLSLPRDTRLFMCHDYKAPGRDDYAWETTVAAEQDSNVHVHKGVSEEEFVKMRRARDKTLPMPTLILPSVQVNMRAGHFPPAEENGVCYLKIPLNLL